VVAFDRGDDGRAENRATIKSNDHDEEDLP
jgi:hypothetical protein